MRNFDNWCFESILAEAKTYDDVFECIIDDWRSFANLDLTEKREARFNFLCNLQRVFTEYDSDITKRIIIALARQCHGMEYEYIIPEIIMNITDPIDIICSEHGVTNLRIIDHLLPPKGILTPRGCYSCLSGSQTRTGRKFNTNMFIAKSELKHGAKYDYRHVKYLGNASYVDIGCIACRNNGRKWLFNQHVKRHLLGKGCATCSILATRMTFKQAVEKSKAVHGELYEYLEILPPDQPNKGQRISYRCKKCGSVHTQLINMHTSGKCGCPNCGRKITGLKNEVPYDEVIKQAKSIHGDKYQYIEALYTSDKHKNRRCLRYICNQCGVEQIQRIVSHLKGHGCTNCNYGGMNLSFVKQPLRFYLLKIVLPNGLYDTDAVYKLGITSREINKRYDGELPDNVRYEVAVDHLFTPGSNAYILEQELLTIFRKPYQYRGDFRLKRAGNGELFVKEGYTDILNTIEQFIAKTQLFK